MTVSIVIGDALERLRELPDESVHCCITSPPYWGLRAYGGDPGMIGLEPTLDEHIANLVEVFREVRRVLRGDGVCFLNYGDAYAAGGSHGGGWANGKQTTNKGSIRGGKTPGDWKPKDLMMLPARVAMALQADGWWLRSEIVWHKPNPMPESVQDRPTSAHEKVFLLSRSAKYFYDAEAVRQPCASGPSDLRKMAEGLERIGGKHKTLDDAYSKASAATNIGQKRSVGDPSGANLRNVWPIATHAFPGAHFATFPPALVEPCILAGTSARGVCGACGAPWVREVKKERVETQKTWNPKAPGSPDRQPVGNGYVPHSMNVTTTGWHPTCDCAAPVQPAVCLDPFAGAGTVGLVAQRLGRDAVLLEINPEYAAMARGRIDADQPGLVGLAV